MVLKGARIAAEAQWAKDYGKAGGCASCAEGGQYFMMVAVVVLFGAVLGYGVWSSIKSAEDEDRTSTMLFKILISFTLTNVEVMKYRQTWPNFLSTIFTFQAEINAKTSVNFADFVAFDCMFASVNSIDRVYNKTAFYMILPLLAVVVPAIPLGAKAAYHIMSKKKMHPTSEGYKKALAGILWCQEVYAASCVVILYQVYPTSVNYSAAMFKGTYMQFDSEEHLDVEQSVVFSDPQYIKWRLVAGIVGLGGYAAGIPFFFGILLYNVRGTMDTLSTSRKYGFLYGGFRPERIWWEAVVMIRKLLFLLSATFLSRESVAFRVGVALIITVTFLVLQLIFLPYPDEFMAVGLMEVLSMLTVFFTYGAVLLMDENVTGRPASDGWSERDGLFLGLIIVWNTVFMSVIGLMILRDVWRHTADHIAEHGVKASIKHLKNSLNEKAKLDKIRSRLEELKSPRDSSRAAENAGKGTMVGKGSAAETIMKKQKKAKRDAVKLMWLRGLSGAATMSRVSRKSMLKSMDTEENTEAVGKGHAQRQELHGEQDLYGIGDDTTPAQVKALKQELHELREKLKKLQRAEVANRLRLGLRENKFIDLKMSGGGGDVANVNLQKIGEVLREEEIKASAGGYEGMQASHDLSKDTDIKRGGGGVETRVAHKADERTESVREQLPLSDEAGHAEEEVSAAETVVSAPQAAGPDMSQAVGEYSLSQLISCRTNWAFHLEWYLLVL